MDNGGTAKLQTYGRHTSIQRNSGFILLRIEVAIPDLKNAPELQDLSPAPIQASRLPSRDEDWQGRVLS